MATYNLTKQVTNPASSSTQNVSSGDTINFTITLPSGISDTTPEVFANPTNCSLNQTSDTSAPFTFTATNFTSSTYSVQFSFVDTDSNTTSYSHTTSGSVTSSIVAPTISGTTFLYYNGETRAAFVSGSTYYVQTRINLSSNGSGGTLEYGRNTSSNTVSGATWQTSNTWNHLVGGTRYYWASQDRDTAGSFDSTGGVTYNYVSPNTVTVANGNVDAGATSKTITITNTTNDYGGVNNRAAEAYSISTVDHGSGEISASTVSASRIGVVDSPSSGTTVNFTISSSLPGTTAGSTQTYYVYAYRRPDWSGKAVYYKTDSFVLTRSAAAITAPVISSVTNNNASDENVTTTVNLSSNGSGGTLKYAQTTTNSVPATGWQTSASFTHPRNTTRYYWASQDEDTAGAFDDSGAIYVGYISPDAVVSVSRSPSGNLAYNSTGDVTVTVSEGTAGDRYRVLRTSVSNLGCGNTGNLTGTSGTVTLDYAVSGELPPAGSTYSYIIQARRDFANGGDETYVNTNATFSITRDHDTEPTQFTFTDVTGVAVNSTQTSNQITIAGITGTVSVSVTGGTYSKNGGSYTSSSGTAVNGDTFRVQHTSSAQNSHSVNTTLVVGDTSDIFTSTTVASSSSTSSYGIQLFDTDGTTKVLSPDERFGTVIAYSSNVTLDSTTTYIDFVMDMTGISAATTTILLISSTFVNTADYGDTFSFLTDRIRVSKPDGATTFYGDILIVRF